MKKFLALIPAAALAFTVASCKKDVAAEGDVISVSSVYKCVVFEYSATWCNPCGVYGYPAMHDLMHEYGETKHQAVGVFLHPSDNIVNNEPAGMEDLLDFFGFSGTPSSAVNAGPDTYPTYLEPKVTQAIAANPTAKAGIGMTHTISGNTVTVTTKTVFFNDVSGSYNLAVYVTEDHIMETQNGQTGEVEHNYILRGIAGAKAFGTPVATNPVKGTKIDGSYTVTLPQETRSNSNLHVVCVLYKMDPATGEPTDVLNSNSY